MSQGIQVFAVVALAVVLSGCPGNAADEMLDTAQLEEVQDNLENASKIYRDIIERYPDSPEAKTAQSRLDAIAR